MEFNITNIMVILLSIVTLTNLVLLIINNIKVKKYKNLYEKALAKFNSHKDIAVEFNSLYERLNEVEKKAIDSVDSVNNLNQKIKNNVQKIGFVKYNAYDDTENKLSFALALLDEHENGVLINHIYSKHGSNIYAKLVTNGKVEDRISEEEATALKEASEDKGFKQRKVIETNKTTKKKANKK
ncbi:MAG: DUF4446 family protein [Clostridia bacterium]|nr:DUF4446 family protein [Clostridia bacterium]